MRKNVGAEAQGEIMKKLVCAIAVVLLSSSWGVAQSSATPEQTPDKQQLAELEKHGKAVEGCLSSEGADLHAH